MVETGRWRPLSSCEILAARYLGAPSHFERRADFTFRRNALGSVVVLGARKRSGVCAAVAQMVRAPVCGTGGRWFEATQLYHLFAQTPCFEVTLLRNYLASKSPCSKVGLFRSRRGPICGPRTWPGYPNLTTMVCFLVFYLPMACLNPRACLNPNAWRGRKSCCGCFIAFFAGMRMFFAGMRMNDLAPRGILSCRRSIR